MATIKTPHGDRVQVTTYLPQEVRIRLKVIAATGTMSMSGVAQYLIEEALAVRAELNLDGFAVTTDEVLARMREPLVAQPKESSF